MTAKAEPRLRLPTGLSPEQEAKWWDRHRDYWDTVETSEEVLGPSSVVQTKPITIRLPVPMLAALRREAGQRAMPYQTLIRMWLKEQLDRNAPPKESA